jgi:hypothetical protein
MTTTTPMESGSSADERDQQTTLRDLLDHAAALSVVQALPLEDFMRTAWQAYMDARPGLRAQLEDRKLTARLDELRARGAVGRA